MARSAALARIRRRRIRRRPIARRSPASRVRSEAKERRAEQAGLLVSGGTGFGIGFAEKQNWALPTFDGIDPIFLYAVASLAGTIFIKDRQIKALLKNTTVGLASVAAYKAGRGGVDSLFKYTKPVPVATAGWGEEIVETGEF